MSELQRLVDVVALARVSTSHLAISLAERALVDHVLSHMYLWAERERLEVAVVEANRRYESDCATGWTDGKEVELAERALGAWVIAHAGVTLNGD